MTSRRQFIQRAISASLLPLLGACGPAAPPSTQGQTPSTAAPTLVPAPMATARGGDETLRLLWWQAPTILNSHLAAGMKDFDAARLVIEPLAALGPDGTPVPVLAAEIPTRDNGGVASDLTSVTWKLKPHVKWSDGSDFTSSDVVFTYQYMSDSATAATDARYARGVDHVEALDPLTVRVRWQEPNAYPYQLYASLFGHILQRKQFEPFLGAHANDAPGNLAPIGTGPFRVVDFKPGDEVTYRANEHYRDPTKPWFKDVHLKGGGDATGAARAAFQTGEVDYAWNLQVEAPVLREIMQNSAGELVTASSSMVERLLFNHSDPLREVDGERSHPGSAHPFLSDVAVRRALAMAVDRKTIAEQLYGPAGDATTNLVVAPAEFSSSNTAGFEHMAFDVPRANQLLDSAGWRRGSDGVREKGGVQLAVLYQTTINPVRQRTQDIVKAGWEALGVRVELKSVPASVFFSSDPGNPDTAGHFYADVQMLTSGTLVPDWAAELSGFTSQEIAHRGNDWHGANSTRYASDDYDRMWRMLKAETDPIRRKELTIALNDHLVREAVIVPLVARRTPVSGRNKRLQGIRANPWDSELWNVADWSFAPS